MHFYNMDKIAQNVGISNKYLLTSIVAHRARQISETKSRRILEAGADEKYISLALADMEAGEVEVHLQAEKIPSVADNDESSVAE